VLKERFFGLADLATAEYDDNNLAEVEMLRVGTFNHPKYGELDITEDFLNKIKANFDGGVLKREVSFDWDHDQKNASSWLRGLQVVDGVLVGSVEFTPRGKQSVSDKEYGYFSVEYQDNYTDAETGDEYGPTLTGGALTNRPFISGLKKIEFQCSEDGVEDSVFMLEEDRLHMDPKDKDKKDVKREPVLDPNAEPKNFAEMQTENKALKTTVSEQSTQLSELANTVKELTDTIKSMKGDLSDKDKENRKLAVEAKCEKLLTEKGHHPSVVAVAKEMMLADNPEDKVIKLSEVVEGKDDEEPQTIEHQLSFTEAIERLLDAIPQSQRPNYEEETSTKEKKQLQEKAEDTGIKAAFRKKGIKPLSEAA
jgi:hypothetical protein